MNNNQNLNHSNNMNLLEMFSGTGSVGTIARSLGFNVISLEEEFIQNPE